MKQCFKTTAFLTVLICTLSASAQTLNLKDSDSHYTKIGFFDVHICNWPDRPPFYMALFSSTQFQNITSVDVYFPNGKLAGNLDMERYRTDITPGKPEKRVFITQLPLSNESSDGWFKATIKTRNGQEFLAQDYVVHTIMAIVHDTDPTSGQELGQPPTELIWLPVLGATHYQITLRDEWDDGRIIFTSPLVTEARVTMPPGLLKQGGRYNWVIHARDSNGSILLGDFNHGSLSAPQTFSVAQ